MLPLDFHVPGPLLHPCLKQSAEVAACKIPEIFRQKLFQFLVADARFCHSDFLSGLILFLGNILVD
jgi:hypothetical protein